MKNYLKAAAIILFVGVTGCATTGEQDDFKRVATLDDYMSTVVGRQIVFGDKKNTTTTHADGTMTGTIAGKPIVGQWEWSNGYFCREGKHGDDVMERDCQVLEVSGDKIKIIRNEGSGSTSIFSLK